MSSSSSGSHVDLTSSSSTKMATRSRCASTSRREAGLLNLVYYTCPMLCNLVLNGQTAALQGSCRGRPANEFEVVTISIDPTRDVRNWRARRRRLSGAVRQAGRRRLALPDRPQRNVKKLADQVGFHYKLGREAGAVRARRGHHVPDSGRPVARYLYGISSSPAMCAWR